MIQKKDCNLRALQEKDLEKVLLWRNSDGIRLNMYNDHIISWEEHLEWFAKVKKEENSRYFIFEYQAQGIGTINISQIDRKNNRCYWGFYLGEKATPRGCGLAMGYYGLNFIFDELGIRKVCGETFAFNNSSLKFHNKLGFKVEGCFREHYLKNGKYEDIVSLALFAAEWLKIKADVEEKIFWGDDNQ